MNIRPAATCPRVVRIFREQLGHVLVYWTWFQGERLEFSEALALRMVRGRKARIITKER